MAERRLTDSFSSNQLVAEFAWTFLYGFNVLPNMIHLYSPTSMVVADGLVSIWPGRKLIFFI